MKIFEKIEKERDLKKLFWSLESAFYGLFGQLRVEFELEKCPKDVPCYKMLFLFWNLFHPGTNLFCRTWVAFSYATKKCKFAVKNGDTQAKNDDDPLFDKNGIKIH